MGMFPEQDGSSDFIHKNSYTERPADERLAKQQDYIIGLLKKSHAVIRALAGGDIAKIEERTRELGQAVMDMGITDDDIITSVTALLLSYGVAVPPSTYGEDITKWEEFDDK